MSAIHQIRLRRILREAGGYLELQMPRQALETLERAGPPGTFRGQVSYLRGEALRALERYAEAIEPLREAAELSPSNINAYFALGWCLKRDRRLPEAIAALETAEKIAPEEALIHYNLACYQSLSGRKDAALASLSQALRLNANLRDNIEDETDFDPIRNDPDFRALTKATSPVR